MPRPYGWIRGEGTAKNQRWGLGGVDGYPDADTIARSGLTNSDYAGRMDWNGVPSVWQGLRGMGVITAQDMADAGLSNSDFAASMNLLNAPSYGPNMSTNFGSYSIYDNSLPMPGQLGVQNLMQWIQANAGLLLVGGVVGLYMFKR